MAPKKAPSKREHDLRAGTSSHGSSKQGTNETNDQEFPLGDHDDESFGVNEGAVACTRGPRMNDRPAQWRLPFGSRREHGPAH